MELSGNRAAAIKAAKDFFRRGKSPGTCTLMLLASAPALRSARLWATRTVLQRSSYSSSERSRSRARPPSRGVTIRWCGTTGWRALNALVWGDEKTTADCGTVYGPKVSPDIAETVDDPCSRRPADLETIGSV